jgi:nucleotide-binding universal stress UspA family protein
MFKKVLIATDGSDHAAKAVAVGADIAAKYGAEVVLVHVLLRGELSENLRHMAEVENLADTVGPSLQQALAAVPEGRFPANINFAAEETATAYRMLTAIGEQVLHRAEQAARDHGVKKLSTHMEDGDPVKRILEVVEKEGADLVVAGARGLSDIKALIVGSVSHKLSHLSPVTCITVR